MSLRKMMILVAAMMFLLPVSKVIAQESITCSDIEWSSAVTDKFPDIKDACYGVVESNGSVMAQIKVKIIGMNSDNIRFRFVRPDNRLSSVYRMAAHPNWVKSIQGAMLDSGGFAHGITMDAYVTNDNNNVILASKNGLNLAETTDPIEVRGSVTESEPTDDVRSATVMPDTAGLLPLFGLLGAGFIGLGGGIRLFRRRHC